MAKKDNKSHHDAGGGKRNHNRQEHQNSLIMRRDPRLNQQQIAYQNLAENAEEGNRHYIQTQKELNEAVEQFNEEDEKYE